MFILFYLEGYISLPLEQIIVLSAHHVNNYFRIYSLSVAISLSYTITPSNH